MMNCGIPIFPTMVPDMVNRLWFSVDEPKNEAREVSQIETIHQNWLLNAVNKMNDKDFPLPIGKLGNELQEEEDDEDEEEEEEVSASDGSETRDEEEDDVEMNVTNNSYSRGSSVSTI